MVLLASVLIHNVDCQTEDFLAKSEDRTEATTDTTAVNSIIEETTISMDDNSSSTSDIPESETQLDQTTFNPTTENKVVTEPSTTAKRTSISDPVKQNILKMFNNLLKSEDDKIVDIDDTETEKDTQTMTTPMTTPSGQTSTTTTQSTSTKNLALTTQDANKASDNFTEEELTTLSTFPANMTTTIISEIIDTKPTTIETMPDTTQTIIKNLITRTTIRSTTFEVTELDTTVTQEGSTHSSIIYTTDKITPIPTSQTRKQASSNTKPETTIISTSVPDENTEVGTTITTPTDPNFRNVEKVTVGTEEMTTWMNTPISESDEVLSKKAIKEGSTTTKEITEEITTEWFYPTTKPKTGSLYNLVQELPFRNSENTIPKLYSHGAPLKTSDTNFPWIFPKWISDQKLSNANQVPRLIQF